MLLIMTGTLERVCHIDVVCSLVSQSLFNIEADMMNSANVKIIIYLYIIML